MINFKIVALIIFFCAILINMYVAQNSDNCVSKRTCSECIRDPKCSWHIKTDENRDHCRSAEQSDKGNNNIVSPKMEAVIIDASSDHLSPKTVHLKIRPGKSYKLDFEYTHKVDYPVDMYFLMDMSKSMQHYRERISVLAEDLVKKMKEKSTEIQIGFGSFVDKTLLPYVNAFPNKVESPCKGCAIPYSFKNHLKLTADVVEFSNKVNSTQISANIDGPEGSLEALLQAIVCTEAIGWRPKARHLIILSTDDAFHIAGDGKLAAIVEPNDGECHLENNEYTHGLLHDYPSVGQIKQKASNKTMNILFLVTPPQEKLYNKLQNAIPNSYIGTLQENSENIINLVTEFYENITSSIRIEHNFGINFDIKLSAINCETSRTKDIECSVFNNEIYKFSADIRLTSCPNDGKYIKYYYIKPNSLTEDISIRIEMLCDCPCENVGHEDYEEHSDKCTKNGDLQCGVCKCNPDKIGDQCQCDISTEARNVDDTTKCRNVNSTEECSGAGQCKCGQCDCFDLYYGRYCQCNDLSCNYKNEICSNNGVCDCGKCICKEDWTGNRCECYKLTDTCKASESSEVCSGKGECKCGKCVCTNTDKEKYGGTFCDECKTCPKTCSDFENCIKFYYNADLNYDDKCDKFTINETENLNITENLCNYQDEQNCLITFAFNYIIGDSSADIFTQKNCPPTQAGIYSLYIIASIFLAGLIAMLIWKAFAMMADRREYAKFEDETKNPTWNAEENPLFKKATSEFQNPLFKKSD